jgi:hypothetical protein
MGFSPSFNTQELQACSDSNKKCSVPCDPTIEDCEGRT